MTQQDFNHIFYKFTGDKKGIKPSDHLSTTGKELKDFVEFVLKQTTLQSSETY
jgi:hypothetical protein